MIISKKKHMRIIEGLKAIYDKDMSVKDTIIRHKNVEIKEYIDVCEDKDVDLNNYIEANKKLTHELHKIRKDYKNLKKKCDRLEKKNKYKGEY